ncbi:uncharacterized protein [Temnothorax longispinosus]|uniref:uncharacterized protein isoform X3 n=1 Tax=Temnothorax longispinosus TaxID=300112 RepID=UPI003A9A3274
MEAIEDELELLEAIQKCYTDLEYDGEDTGIADKAWKSYSAETKIITLGKKMNLADRNNFSDSVVKSREDGVRIKYRSIKKIKQGQSEPSHQRCLRHLDMLSLISRRQAQRLFQLVYILVDFSKRHL